MVGNLVQLYLAGRPAATPLSWSLRLKIAIGAAWALHSYTHQIYKSSTVISELQTSFLIGYVSSLRKDFTQNVLMNCGQYNS